ncbi:hypothetical protein BJ741DRAFT_584020 [Chytriomyces cf. hyalinus JEL632]|nr:hypothetical protein BJ741DRAFT_584020 [Chytriomyces cf. hyalinus JEL632]
MADVCMGKHDDMAKTRRIGVSRRSGPEAQQPPSHPSHELAANAWTLSSVNALDPLISFDLFSPLDPFFDMSAMDACDDAQQPDVVSHVKMPHHVVKQNASIVGQQHPLLHNTACTYESPPPTRTLQQPASNSFYSEPYPWSLQMFSSIKLNHNNNNNNNNNCNTMSPITGLIKDSFDPFDNMSAPPTAHLTGVSLSTESEAVHISSIYTRSPITPTAAVAGNADHLNALLNASSSDSITANLPSSTWGSNQQQQPPFPGESAFFGNLAQKEHQEKCDPSSTTKNACHSFPPITNGFSRSASNSESSGGGVVDWIDTQSDFFADINAGSGGASSSSSSSSQMKDVLTNNSGGQASFDKTFWNFQHDQMVNGWNHDKLLDQLNRSNGPIQDSQHCQNDLQSLHSGPESCSTNETEPGWDIRGGGGGNGMRTFAADNSEDCQSWFSTFMDQTLKPASNGPSNGKLKEPVQSPVRGLNCDDGYSLNFLIQPPTTTLQPRSPPVLPLRLETRPEALNESHGASFKRKLSNASTLSSISTASWSSKGVSGGSSTTPILSSGSVDSMTRKLSPKSSSNDTTTATSLRISKPGPRLKPVRTSSSKSQVRGKNVVHNFAVGPAELELVSTRKSSKTASSLVSPFQSEETNGDSMDLLLVSATEGSGGGGLCYASPPAGGEEVSKKARSWSTGECNNGGGGGGSGGGGGNGGEDLVCFCGQGPFSSRNSLRAHSHIHGMGKRHECKECGKAFLRAQECRRHEATHNRVFHPNEGGNGGGGIGDEENVTRMSRQNLFSCELCSTSFTRRDALMRHLKNRICTK